MPTILPGYDSAVSALEPVLLDLPGTVIGIDGRNGVGKTTFGRYLAWYFNVSLIESDLFLKDGSFELGYRLDDINRLIQLRLDKLRPVILEGIGLFRLLDHLDRRADFSIYCQSSIYTPGDALSVWLDEYDHDYSPRKRASLIVDLEWGDS